MNWSNEDAVGLREYLSTQSGKNLIENLKSTYVELGGKNFEEQALISRERKGQETIINTILANALHDERPDVATNVYVNTDDSPR